MLVTTFAELHRRGKSIKVWSSHNFRKRLENFWDCNYLSLDTYILEVLEDLLDVLKRKKREGRQGDILVKTTVSSEDFIVWSPKNGPKSFFLSGGEIFLLVLYIDKHCSKSLHFVGKLQGNYPGRKMDFYPSVLRIEKEEERPQQSTWLAIWLRLFYNDSFTLLNIGWEDCCCFQESWPFIGVTNRRHGLS